MDTEKFKIIILPVGQLQTNCFLFIDKKGLDALIIDPGDGADYIERIIADHKCNPVKIIATHGHFDHIMAGLELQLAYNIPFVIHKKDEFLVKKMRSSAGYFLGVETDPPPQVNEYLKDKDKIKFGKIELQVMETPGHTPGGICLYDCKENILFCGDLLFAGGGVGRTDFSYSNEDDLKKSLKKIFRLPENTIVYPGHGDYTSVGEEKRMENE